MVQDAAVSPAAQHTGAAPLFSHSLGGLPTELRLLWHRWRQLGHQVYCAVEDIPNERRTSGPRCVVVGHQAQLMKDGPSVGIATRCVSQAQEAVVDERCEQAAPSREDTEDGQRHEEDFSECHKTEDVPALVFHKVRQPRAEEARTAPKLVKQGQRKACRVQQREKEHRQKHHCAMAFESRLTH